MGAVGTTGGRPCTICNHPSVNGINAGLKEGSGLAMLAATYGVSASSLSRHQNGHLKPQLALVEAHADFTPMGIVERLVEVADDARDARRLAKISGSAIARSRAIDIETKTLVALADRLGIDDLSVTELLAEADQFVRAIGDFARRDPASATSFVTDLRNLDLDDFANNLENLIARKAALS